MQADAQASAYFPLKPGTKEPGIKAWDKVTPGKYAPDGDYGIALTETDLVIDADPRNYPPGREVLNELMDEYKLPQTKVVKTPGGGYHFYFAKPESIKVRKKQAKYPGIDFLSKGQYICGAGSKNDQGEYIIVVDALIAPVPAELLTNLEEQATAVQDSASPSLLMAKQFADECTIAAPAISGQNGDGTTYVLACRGRDLGLPKDVVYEYMRDNWNPLCIPPWDDSDLYAKVENAFKYAKNGAGNASPEAKFTPPTEAPKLVPTTNLVHMDTYQADLLMHELKPVALQMTNEGKIKATAANVLSYLSSEPAIKGKLRINEFSDSLEFTGRPPWRSEQLNLGIELNERDEALIRVWFSNAKQLEITADKLRLGILAAAKPYHPVKEYLKGVKWDGTPRLDKILIDTAGAQDIPYVREVGKNILISAVKRVFEPGCKQDYLAVLEGKQGEGKSRWIETLGGLWYSANELVRGDKDTYQNLRGRWIVELPEINATFSKADYNWLKGIISNSKDVYRASFGRGSKSVPRESIFIGTINPNASNRYLKDDENRRYWPIKTGRFDIEALEFFRDQYFAEAVVRYRKGEAAWLTTTASNDAAREQQLMRQEPNYIAECLAPWVALRTEGFLISDASTWLSTQGIKYTSYQVYNALHALNCEYQAGMRNDGKWSKRIEWENLL